MYSDPPTHPRVCGHLSEVQFSAGYKPVWFVSPNEGWVRGLVKG